MLLKSGNVIINMDHLIAVRDDGDTMVLQFGAGPASTEDEHGPISMTLQAEGAHLMRLWLMRMGVHDLKTEGAIFSLWGA